MSNTSYSQYVESIAQQYAQLSAQSFSLLPLLKPANLSDQPRILILAPHPDDECLMAGCALRMQEEWNAKVTVVPFSFGSDPSRRTARSLELKEAVSVLGFQLYSRASLDKITDVEFMDAVKKINPEILISPHPQDLHPTHVEAAVMAKEIVHTSVQPITWIQTEYWQAAKTPTHFIPLSSKQVIKIGEALMKHVGEISRNPYHLSLPAWYMDQARRAPEVLGSGFGGKSNAMFGQLLTIK